MLLLTYVRVAPAASPSGDWRQWDQSYCQYWLRHFDDIHRIEEELIEAKQHGSTLKSWHARYRIHKILKQSESDAYGEMEHRADRLYEDDDRSDWFNDEPRF